MADERRAAPLLGALREARAAVELAGGDAGALTGAIEKLWTSLGLTEPARAGAVAFFAEHHTALCELLLHRVCAVFEACKDAQRTKLIAAVDLFFVHRAVPARAAWLALSSAAAQASAPPSLASRALGAQCSRIANLLISDDEKWSILFSEMADERVAISSSQRSLALAALLAVPDRLARLTEGRAPATLRHAAFFALVLDRAFGWAAERADEGSTQLLAHVFSSLVRCGFPFVVARRTVALAQAQSHSEAQHPRHASAFLRIASRAFAACHPSAVERLALALLACVSTSSSAVDKALLWRALVGEAAAQSDSTWHFVITQRLPCSVPLRRGELQLLLELVRYEPRTRARVLENATSLWGQEAFVRHAARSLHEHVTRVVLALLDSEREQAASAPAEQGGAALGHGDSSPWLSFIMDGVQRRLGHSIPWVQHAGMRVAEAFSLVVDPQNPLRFSEAVDSNSDAEASDDGESARRFFALDEESDAAWGESEQKERSGKVDPVGGEAHDAEVEPPTEHTHRVSLAHPSSAFNSFPPPLPSPSSSLRPPAPPTHIPARKRILASSSPSSGTADAAPVKPVSASASSLLQEEDEPALAPYDLADDRSDLARVPPPRYARELLDYLNKNLERDAEFVATALAHALPLLRPEAAVADLGELAGDLTRALFHLGSNMHLIPRGRALESARLEALTALVARFPEASVPLLVSRFHDAGNQMISQRISVLDVLNKAAWELSSSAANRATRADEVAGVHRGDSVRSPADIYEMQLAAARFPLEVERAMSKADREAIIRARVEKRTRRWGRRSNDAAAANPFARLAPFFFFPLMHPPRALPLLSPTTILLLSQSQRSDDAAIVQRAMSGQDFDQPPPQSESSFEDGEALVASRLLAVAANILFCAGAAAPRIDAMATELMERVLAHRFHKQPAVRRACIEALLKVFSVVPPFVLAGELQPLVLEAIAWLQHVRAEDPEPQCQALVLPCLGELQRKMEALEATGGSGGASAVEHVDADLKLTELRRVARQALAL